MGIAQFFSWFKNNFSSNIKKIKNGEVLSVNIENLIIDMNGLFHNSAQKVYEYGNYKRNIKFLEYKKPHRTQQDVFIDVCKSIEDIFLTVNPTKRLILVVDGPAPKCKLNQQRQRRYRSALDRNEDDTSFDSNCISPGTRFMDNLSKYIDWYIKKKITEDSKWRKIEVIFSNEKAPAEGEQKAFSFIRKFCDKNESYCLHGADADLIMLGLATHIENFYILRDNTFYDRDENDKFLLVNLGHTSLQLAEMMSWDGDDYNPKTAINDFVFLCFTLGNDFLPHIPGIEIIEGGIDTILNVYRDVGKFNGHITDMTADGKIIFKKIPLKIFFQMISEYEKPVLEHKLKNKKIYFEDKLLEECSMVKENGNYELDITKYRREYCKKYFGTAVKGQIEKVCHSYLEGLQFVILYYTSDVPSWNWNFPHYYAPSTYLLSLHIDTFSFKKYDKNTPLLPFQQLMYILPPKSFNLLPNPLDTLHSHKSLEDFYPEKVDIDLDGKKNDWQGIVLLPQANLETIKYVHNEHSNLMDIRDIKRNILGKTFKYSYVPFYNSIVYKSYYGDISNYKIRTNLIDI